MLFGSAMAMLLAVTTAGSAAAQPDGASSAARAEGAGVSAPLRTDVWMKDNDADTGHEPSTGTIYWSPDIKVCNGPIECATHQNPIGGTTNWVFVTLRRPGPKEQQGRAEGRLMLYRTAGGGGTAWPTSWVYIGSAYVADVPYGTTTVRIPWVDTPDYGHFCLLARWVSDSDPMTYAEGSITTLNTSNNNNIAWRNVDIIPVQPGQGPTRVPFVVENALDVPTLNGIRFTQPNGLPFDRVGGQVVVDLGEDLFERWRRGGLAGTNVKYVGGTEVQIVDPAKASLDNIELRPGERLTFHLHFSARVPSQEQFQVNVALWGPASPNDKEPIDLGGVLYVLDISGRGDRK